MMPHLTLGPPPTPAPHARRPTPRGVLPHVMRPRGASPHAGLPRDASPRNASARVSLPRVGLPRGLLIGLASIALAPILLGGAIGPIPTASLAIGPVSIDPDSIDAAPDAVSRDAVPIGGAPASGPLHGGVPFDGTAGIAAQSTQPTASPFVAFRVDRDRVIATLRAFEDPAARQVFEGLSTPRVAAYGYRYFDPPAAWRAQIPGELLTQDRWRLHAAPGRTFDARAERVVGGNATCTEAVGVLMRIVPDQAAAFAGLPARYFLAEAEAEADREAAAGVDTGIPSPEPSGNAGAVPLDATSRPPLGALPASSIDRDTRRAIESVLERLLAREWPRVRADAQEGRARMAASTVGDHRAWARAQQRMEDGLANGRARLTYDVQAFRLAPDASVQYFVRAEWLVGRQQAFAAAVWLRGDRAPEIVETHLRPAAWLRTFMFQRGIGRAQLGLVLTVLDHDRDGWGEVLLARGGYESMTLSLLEYSSSGFQPTTVGYTYGC